MQWSIFCRVVDNFGDIGVAWRLAADLGNRGEQVRLVVDDALALAWMAPGGARHVEIAAWADGEAPNSDIWIETFGCGWPDDAAARLAAMAKPPLCIDVEHLSAEPFVARSHGLPLPRFNAAGEVLPIWFFYPGFDARTGGLLREPGLLERRRTFGDGRAWLAAQGIDRREDERCVSLFCYDGAPIEAMLQALVATPTLLLLTPGPATLQVDTLLAQGLGRDRLRTVRLPLLSQVDFDALLWSVDLNLVRGEDSFVRAMWAGVPFVWQAYPQDDGVHAAKVDAFLSAFLAGAPDEVAGPVRDLYARWNGTSRTGASTPLRLPDSPAWAGQCMRWRDRLAALPDLTTSLLGFVASKR